MKSSCFLICIFGFHLLTSEPGHVHGLISNSISDINSNATTYRSTTAFSELASTVLKNYNDKAVLNYGDHCSYQDEMEFLADVILSSIQDLSPPNSFSGSDNGNLGNNETRLKFFEKLETLITNSKNGFCNYQKMLSCHKNNKCSCGSAQLSAQTDSNHILEDGHCRFKLNSPCTIPKNEKYLANLPEKYHNLLDLSNTVRNSYSFSCIKGSRCVNVHDMQDCAIHDNNHVQNIYRNNLVNNDTYEIGSSVVAVDGRCRCQLQRSVDSISKFTKYLHIFLLSTSMAVMMSSFVLS